MPAAPRQPVAEREYSPSPEPQPERRVQAAPRHVAAHEPASWQDFVTPPPQELPRAVFSANRVFRWALAQLARRSASSALHGAFSAWQQHLHTRSLAVASEVVGQVSLAALEKAARARRARAVLGGWAAHAARQSHLRRSEAAVVRRRHRRVCFGAWSRWSSTSHTPSGQEAAGEVLAVRRLRQARKEAFDAWVQLTSLERITRCAANSLNAARHRAHAALGGATLAVIFAKWAARGPRVCGALAARSAAMAEGRARTAVLQQTFDAWAERARWSKERRRRAARAGGVAWRNVARWAVAAWGARARRHTMLGVLGRRLAERVGGARRFEAFVKWEGLVVRGRLGRRGGALGRARTR